MTISKIAYFFPDLQQNHAYTVLVDETLWRDVQNPGGYKIPDAPKKTVVPESDDNNFFYMFGLGALLLAVVTQSR